MNKNKDNPGVSYVAKPPWVLIRVWARDRGRWPTKAGALVDEQPLQALLLRSQEIAAGGVIATVGGAAR